MTQTGRALSRTALHLAALAALTLSQAAHAISFERLNADGSGSGTFYTPTLSDWVFAPNASGTAVTAVGDGWQIDVGTNNFGSGEGGQQTSGIFGAGLVLPSSDHGWRVNFDANLRTWDSYNDGSVVQPNPGGSLGDWDLFAVNTNSQAFYWNMVSGGGTAGGGSTSSLAPTVTSVAPSGLIDPLVPTRPAGSVVGYSNTTGDSRYLPGNTWAWGGRDYAAGYFESVHTQGNVVTASGSPQYVSFVLDTHTPSFNDTNYPSWGRFGVAGQSGEVPDASNGEGPGGSIANPILPVGVSSSGEFLFSPIEIGEGGIGLEEFLYIDPAVASGYVFSLKGSSSKFKELLLPTLGDKDGYTIEVLDEHGNWVSIGHVADGGDFTFVDGVTVFRVVGIDTDLGLDPSNPAAFITGIKLDKAGTIEVSMKAETTAVPEPASAMLLAGGMLAMATLRRRNKAIPGLR